MHEPRHHGLGFDPYSSVVARISSHRNIDLFWN
jgi:hypothetical protein